MKLRWIRLVKGLCIAEKKREFQTQWNKDEGQLVIFIGARL